MSDIMTQEEAMNMSNEQAVQILIPMRNMMHDQNGCPISDAAFALDKAIEALSADRPSEIIYGNEHNCIMTIFGECSYAETGCGDCAVVEKVRKALSTNRPQGKWIEKAISIIDDMQSEGIVDYEQAREYRMRARMKGSDDYERAIEQTEHDMLYEPTYNSEDGGM